MVTPINGSADARCVCFGIAWRRIHACSVAVERPQWTIQRTVQMSTRTGLYKSPTAGLRILHCRADVLVGMLKHGHGLACNRTVDLLDLALYAPEKVASIGAKKRGALLCRFPWPHTQWRENVPFIPHSSGFLSHASPMRTLRVAGGSRFVRGRLARIIHHHVGPGKPLPWWDFGRKLRRAPCDVVIATEKPACEPHQGSARPCRHPT
jgi:hypothetical protein